MKRWTIIFKALANVNRLKIIALLASGGSMIVSDIASEIDISFKSTSKHLIMLKNLGVLDSTGKEGHVHYSLQRNIPPDFRKTLTLFLNKRSK